MGASLSAYFIASVFYLANLHVKNRRLADYGNLLAVVGFGLQTCRLALQIFRHSTPFLNAAEAIFFFSWLTVGLYLAILLRFRLAAVGALALPLATAALALIYRLPSSMGNVMATGGWIKIHVIAIVSSFALFTLAFCCAIFYLVQNKLLKSKKLKGMFRRLPPLQTVDSLGRNLVVIGFPLLTLGIVTGMVGVRIASLQAPNAKIRLVLSIVAWIAYAAYLIAHRSTGWRGRRANLILVIGALLIAFITALHKFA